MVHKYSIGWAKCAEAEDKPIGMPIFQFAQMAEDDAYLMLPQYWLQKHSTRNFD